MVHQIQCVAVFWRKLPTKFLVVHLVRHRSYNVDELKTVTVSHHHELSLVTRHIEHVKQTHHFKEELFCKIWVEFLYCISYPHY